MLLVFLGKEIHEYIDGAALRLTNIKGACDQQWKLLT